MIEPTTLAIDIDLGRIHAWSTVEGRVCYQAPGLPERAILSHELVLVEVASPTFYAEKRGELHQRARWAIFASYVLGFLYACYRTSKGDPNRLLLSPSTSWTLSYEEKLREEIAGCAGQDNHDIRACRCMVHFHRTNPDKWTTVEEYLRKLIDGKSENPKAPTQVIKPFSLET
jgi:hypothetical protein